MRPKIRGACIFKKEALLWVKETEAHCSEETFQYHVCGVKKKVARSGSDHTRPVRFHGREVYCEGKGQRGATMMKRERE